VRARTGCAIPDIDPAALAVTITAVNTTILPILQDVGTAEEFTIRADVSAVHVVVDVVGSLWAPVRAVLVCQTVSATGAIPANNIATVNSPPCPAGTAFKCHRPARTCAPKQGRRDPSICSSLAGRV